MNPWRSLRGLPRDLYVVALATLVNRAGTMVVPFLVLYLTDSVGLSAELAGGILIAYGVAGLSCAPLAGWLCDRIGARRVAIGSLLSSAALFAMYPLAHTPAQVVLASAALAFFGEAFRPASLALFGDLASKEQKKSAFALQRLAVNVGMSIGPAVGGLLAAWWFPAIFLVDGATALFAGLILLMTLQRADTARTGDGPGDGEDDQRDSSEDARKHDKRDDSGDSTSPAPRSAYTDLPFLYFLLSCLFIGFVFFQLHGAMPLYLVRDLGMSEAMFGVVFTINTAIIIVLEVPLNAAMASWSHRRAMTLGAVLCGVGMAAVGLASGFVEVAATVVVWTFGEMILFPSSAAYVSDISPPGRSGQYMGVYSMAFGLSFSVSPWAGVALLDRAGPDTLWTVVLLAGLLAAVLLALVKDPPQTSTGT